MADKEKPPRVEQTPEAAIQKADRVIVVGNLGRVNTVGNANTLLDAMLAAGLAPAKEIELIADGRIHRYRVRGDKPASRHGWYVLHSQPVQAGAFGSWKTGESHNWREGKASGALTPAERDALYRHLRAAQLARCTAPRCGDMIDFA